MNLKAESYLQIFILKLVYSFLNWFFKSPFSLNLNFGIVHTSQRFCLNEAIWNNLQAYLKIYKCHFSFYGVTFHTCDRNLLEDHIHSLERKYAQICHIICLVMMSHRRMIFFGCSTSVPAHHSVHQCLSIPEQSGIITMQSMWCHY